MTLQAPVRPASRNFPPCPLVHVVPRSFQGKQELYSIFTIVFLCLPLVERGLIPMCLAVSSGFGGARVEVMASGFSAEASAPLSCPPRTLTNLSDLVRNTRLLHTSSRLGLMVACHGKETELGGATAPSQGLQESRREKRNASGWYRRGGRKAVGKSCGQMVRRADARTDTRNRGLQTCVTVCDNSTWTPKPVHRSTF